MTVHSRKRGLSAAIALALLAPRAFAQQLPVPCIGGNCAGGPSVWVTGGEATASISGNQLTVNQTSDRAILNWASFNVGPDGSVVFEQPDAASIALNRIYQQDPSVILGAVSANGQVYLINPNGLVFGQGSRVNVQSLIASTLDVDDAIFQSSGVVLAIDQDGRAAFEGGSAPDARIAVEQGAELVAAGGGRIVILAPEVINEGRIETPDGQAVLAASTDRVFLQASDDNNLRGLLVEVDTGGTVTNLGDIVAERGNITLAGLAVNQQGNLTATTSVRSNGSIRLLARDQAEAVILGGNRPVLETTNAGTLTFGEGSVTQVIPELDDPELAVDEQAQGLSFIEAMGRQVTLASNSTVRATGGDISIQATVNPRALGTAQDPNEAQIFLASGAVIDASGDDSTVVAMERNVVEIELRGNELADAPLQRDSVIRGEPVSIDVRVGTPLANVDGALDAVERGVGERLATGGTITLGSEGSVVVNDGAVIDVSGGQVRYEDGIINTTQLVSNGQIVDIGEADPNVVYDAIATGYVYFHERWGVTETFPEFGGSQGRFEAGYVEGLDAGTINIAAPDALLNGRFVAGRTVGRLQRLPTDFTLATDVMRPFDQVPAGGALNINFAQSPRAQRGVTFGASVPVVIAPGAVLPPGREASIPLSVFSDGVQQFTLATNGDVTIGSETHIELLPGSIFDVTGRNLDIAGQISSVSGSVRLASRDLGTQNAPLTLADTAVIDVSGSFVNDFRDSDSNTLGPVFVDGGSITLVAAGDLTFSENARLAANGGVHVLDDGTVEAGRGGDVSLSANLDFDDVSIQLDGQIESVALEQGGTLALEANRIVVGEAALDDASDPSTLVLDEALLEESGFANIALTSNRRGLLIADGTNLELVQRNAALNDNYLQLATGSAVPYAAQTIVRPILERGPVSLSLSSDLSTLLTADDAVADLVWAPTATVVLDPGAQVAMTSESSLFFDGTLIAPSAAVSMTVSNTPQVESVPLYRPTQQIRLGENSLIDTRGRVLIQPDDQGFRIGRVTDGGSVSIQAQLGSVIADPGSRVDVSGISGVLDLTVDDPVARVPVLVTGRAGAIDIQAAEAVVLGGELVGRSAGTDDSEGGSLSVAIDPNLRVIDVTDPVVFPTFPDAPPRLVLTRSQAPVVLGRDTPLPDALQGRATVSENMIESGGFAQVALTARDYIANPVSVGGAIEIENGVDLSVSRALTLSASTVRMNGGSASLGAPLVVMGSAQQPRRVTDVPAPGSGVLNVSGNTLDLRGALTLGGIGDFNLAAADAVRLRGELPEALDRELTGRLQTAGSVTINAPLMYPTILSDYTFDLSGDTSTFTLVSDGAVGTPLSVAGRLSVDARDIAIDGNVLAPFGTIELNADNTLNLGDNAVVSVASGGQNVLFGRTQGEIDWIYPLSGTQTLVYGSGTNVTAPPERRVALNADAMTLAPGAVVDLSGGGDLLAYEFVPGPGGSTDILDPSASPSSFAVVPGFTQDYAPVDPLESDGFGYAVGTRIVVADGSSLPAGEYTILPPRYALLPGAFLLTERSDTLDALPGLSLPDTDGVPIIAGRFAAAGSGASDTRWQGFRVENGAQVRDRAEYVESSGNIFFAEQAASLDLASPLLPQDAGSLVLDIGTSATLSAQVLARGDGNGLGGRVDIAAANIEVVGTAGASSGGVELLADELNALAVDSLTLGGVRRQNDNRTDLETRADSLIIEDGVSLDSPELILVARDLDIGDDVTLTASGDVGTSQDLVASGDGALVVVSADDINGYRRENAQELSGSLSIGEGTELNASRSLVLDSTGNIEQNGTLSANNGRIILSASLIGLGDAPANAEGLILQDDQINALDASELVLLSRSAVELYSDVDLSLDRLDLRGAGLFGRQPNGLSATISVAEFALSNPFGAVSVAPADGVGDLAIIANTILFGEGSQTIGGFSSIGLSAVNTVQAQGDANLTLLADTLLDTGAIVGAAGAMLNVDASGFGLTLTGTPGGDAVTGGLGSTIALTADTLSVATDVVAPSGTISLTGGTVTIDGGATLDVAGTTVQFDDVSVNTAGGTVALTATSGDVVLASDASVDVSGAGPERAGRLDVSAGAGTARLLGSLRAEGAGGDASVDVGTLDSFSALNTQLAGGGFEGARNVRLRSGDLMVAVDDTVTASDIALAADTGEIIVDGTLRAAGGRVVLDAQDAVRVTGVVDVSDTDRGGDVQLRAFAQDAVVQLGAGSVFDLGGATQDGTLAVALGEGGDPADRFVSNGTVRNAAAAVFAPERTVDVGDTLSAADLIDLIDTMLADNAAADASFLAGLNAGQVSWQRRPSLVVTTAGDLSVSGDVSLLEQRLDGAPGALTLRAGGNLSVDGTLSDGVFEARDFANQPLLQLSDDNSFDLRLVAGADLAAASLDSTLTMGDLILADGTVIRTGTGDLRLRAGGSLVLGDGASAYTAGASTGVGSLPSALEQFVFQGVEYPDSGGDLDIFVGGDIQAVDAGQFVSDWLFRAGGPSTTAGDVPTLYGVSLQNFGQTFAAFGGGDVRIRAGGSVRDVSIALPATAQHVGDAFVIPGGITIVTSDNSFLERPSGSLDLQAQGDVQGLLAYVANGELRLRAGGDILDRDDGLGAVLMLGDAAANVSAIGDVNIESIINPTVLPQSQSQILLSAFESYYFTYGDSSAARLVSLAGDVVVDNDRSLLIDVSGLNFSDITRRGALQIYPSRLFAAALRGDVKLNNQMTLFPSPTGNLDLLAFNNVETVGAAATVRISNADVALLPFPDRPESGTENFDRRLVGAGRGLSEFVDAAVPVHIDDEEPSRIVTLNGSVRSDLLFNLVSAEPVTIRAARDVRNVNLLAQNIRENDATRVIAGRDVRFDTTRNENGRILNRTSGFEIAGPGRLNVFAGRDIDLGASNGVLSIGNRLNSTLAERGADVTLLAGIQDGADFDGFFDLYFEYLGRFGTELSDYLLQVSGESLSGDQALAAFRALPEELREPLILDTFFAEIEQSGVESGQTVRRALVGPDGEEVSASVEIENFGFVRGFAAIDALFPGSRYAPDDPDAVPFLARIDGELVLLTASTATPPTVVRLEDELAFVEPLTGTDNEEITGDLRIFFSRVQTTDGGDISVLVPGGEVNAGLAAIFEGAKPADELGIVVQGEGDISGYVRDDFLVNQSRVFALDGGDILIWSTLGNIDAGRGAKTALAAPEPLVSLDSSGNIVVEFPPTISGSGIRAGVSTRGRDPGTVFLFAPDGVVNAGDAGIGSAGDVFIAATAVVGGDNISAGGAITAPLPVTGVAAGLAGVSNATAGAANAATEQVADTSESDTDGDESLASAALAWLDMFVLGFGEDDDNTRDNDGR